MGGFIFLWSIAITFHKGTYVPSTEGINYSLNVYDKSDIISPDIRNDIVSLSLLCVFLYTFVVHLILIYVSTLV